MREEIYVLGWAFFVASITHASELLKHQLDSKRTIARGNATRQYRFLSEALFRTSPGRCKQRYLDLGSSFPNYNGAQVNGVVADTGG